jgi:hypothetical protein
MIHVMKSLLTALLFLLFFMETSAGDFYLSPQFAYGKSTGNRNSDPDKYELIHLFGNTDDLIFLRTGAMISYEHKWLSYATGLLYSRVIIDQQYSGRIKGLTMLQLPLWCNLHIGKTLYGYLGLGTYLNYLYKQEKDSEVRFPDFQPGIAMGIGIGYRFCSSLAIDISYRAENGLSPLYSLWLSTSAGPWGHAYWAGQDIPFRTLTLSLTFKIGNKNNECYRKS